MDLDQFWRAEISRKVLHLLSASIPLTYLLLPRDPMLGLLGLGVLIAVTVELLRHALPPFQAYFRRCVGFMVRSGEWGRITGATYVMIGALLCVWLFPKPIAIAALLIESVSDSAASLIGLRYGREQFLGKSLAGSTAFFLTALAILWAALPEARGVAFIAALVATATEALPAFRWGMFELNDNVLVPLMTALCVMILGVQATVGQFMLA